MNLNSELSVAILLLKNPSRDDAVNLTPVQNHPRHLPDHVAHRVESSELWASLYEYAPMTISVTTSSSHQCPWPYEMLDISYDTDMLG